MQIILNPPREDIRKWGPLAYVSADERAGIMDRPCGEFKDIVKQLEKEIAYAKKKSKKVY